MNNPWVTIIIPVYNSEQFLEDTILSAVNQSYINLEIIIINDGSTDGSANIIHRYADLDSRIRVFEKENEGLVMARKQGLELATGEYIQFLDSDDTLLLDAIELLVEKAESTHADIVALPFLFSEPEGVSKNSSKIIYSELDGLKYFSEILNGRGYWSVWSNFQKTSFVKSVSLSLYPAFFFGEDAVWMTQLLLHNPKVASLEKTALVYNWNPNSLTNCGNIIDARYKSFRGFQVWMEDYLRQKGMYELYERDLGFQHIETAFTSIEWGKLEDVAKDMKRISYTLKKFPELKVNLSRRQKKLVFLYNNISVFIGRRYLNNCIKKNKYLGK